MLETRFHRGSGDRPLVLFIHGMGMDLRVWASPSEARVLAGRYPLAILLGENHQDLRNTFSDLIDHGFSVLVWSQSRPAGPIGASVKELTHLIEDHRAFIGNGVMFICHSRGGLVARKFLEHAEIPVRGLVTFATPHHGTTMAKWGAYLAPYASFLDRALSGYRKRDILPAFRRVLRFLGSTGLKELLPGSSFYRSLRDTMPEGCRCLSLGGTNPDLVRLRGLSLADLSEKLFPERFIPQELRRGRGDGMVTAQSARFPSADLHHDMPVNHAEILFDPVARRIVSEFVMSL